MVFGMELTLLSVQENGEVVNTGIRRHLQELERCIYCDELTDVPRDTPIDEREFYVDGLGQLHESCHDVIHNIIKHQGSYPIDGDREIVLTGGPYLQAPMPKPISKEGKLRAMIADLFVGF